ncbi:hypothetical protein VPJ54_16460, partial [Acinetobacter baumannii]
MTESTTPKFAIPELPMQIQTIRQYLPQMKSLGQMATNPSQSLEM